MTALLDLANLQTIGQEYQTVKFKSIGPIADQSVPQFNKINMQPRKRQKRSNDVVAAPASWNRCSADVLASILSYLDLKEHFRCSVLSKGMIDIGNRVASFPKIVPLNGQNLEIYDPLCKRIPNLVYNFSYGDQFLFADARDTFRDGLASKRIVWLTLKQHFYAMPFYLGNLKRLSIQKFLPPSKFISQLPYLESLDIDMGIGSIGNEDHLMGCEMWRNHLIGVDRLTVYLSQGGRDDGDNTLDIASSLAIIDSIAAKQITIKLCSIDITKAIVTALSAMKRLTHLHLSSVKLCADAPLTRLPRNCHLSLDHRGYQSYLNNEDHMLRRHDRTEQKQKENKRDWSASLSGCSLEELHVALTNEKEATVLCNKILGLKNLTVHAGQSALPHLIWPAAHPLQSLIIHTAIVSDASIFPPSLTQLSFVNGMSRPCQGLARLTHLEALTVTFQHTFTDEDDKGDRPTFDFADLRCPKLSRLKIGNNWHRRLANIKNVESLSPALRVLDLNNLTVDCWNWAALVQRWPELRELELHSVKGIDYSRIAPIISLVNLRVIDWRGPEVNQAHFQRYVNPQIHLPRLTDLRLMDDSADFVKAWTDRDVKCSVNECANCSLNGKS
jgi:hypothetical protein